MAQEDLHFLGREGGLGIFSFEDRALDLTRAMETIAMGQIRGHDKAASSYLSLFSPRLTFEGDTPNVGWEPGDKDPRYFFMIVNSPIQQDACAYLQVHSDRTRRTASTRKITLAPYHHGLGVIDDVVISLGREHEVKGVQPIPGNEYGIAEVRMLDEVVGQYEHAKRILQRAQRDTANAEVSASNLSHWRTHLRGQHFLRELEGTPYFDAVNRVVDLYK